MTTTKVLDSLRNLDPTERIERLKAVTRGEDRFLSMEQAHLITESYRRHAGEPRVLQRAYALAHALQRITVRVDPDELIVGNRTAGIRAGVVSPEAGIAWIDEELETLPDRPQDPFNVREEDAVRFRREILPFWQGNTLEDAVETRLGDRIHEIKSVAKINQTDHAQGHICPDVYEWLRLGPAGLRRRALDRLGRLSGTDTSTENERSFLQAVAITMDAASDFYRRYAEESRLVAVSDEPARICDALASRPPRTFHEALQAVWILFVILQMESNASSFSPGRLDQILIPFLEQDLEENRLTPAEAMELVDALWVKFNQIVYMRNAGSAEYFAGFPIGFNVAIGGMLPDGTDGTNILSWVFLRAQEHIGFSQPNLSARLWKNSPQPFVEECARVIGLGSGMPQIVNDESIIPALLEIGIAPEHARDYAIVGCVEISTPGNNLGWSDAAMFNLVKVLELTLNDGICMLTGRRLGLDTGTLEDYATFEDLQNAYRTQLDFFIGRMIPLCDAVDRMHAEFLPSPFLSGVIRDCIDNATDVTAGGAHYNLSGIQAIQIANVADSLAALKTLVYDDDTRLGRQELLHALRTGFENAEPLRQQLIRRAPKYGNDIEWVDMLGAYWADYVAGRLREFTNARGGPYQMGLYTVSAHVPMGKNVAATPDGRHPRDPLADGGVSAMYGRDLAGPTALLRSVARLPFHHAGNGTLLNMKFLPRTFADREERLKFVALVRALVELGIHHAQFNVVSRETLLEAQKNPEEYENLTIRVAGYTAYFVELAPDLQNEIIKRTAYGI